MLIKFLGTGGAFDHEYGNSSAWISWKGKRILLDCGSTVYGALRRAHLSDQIDHILITHFHDDHIGSLSTTILNGHFFQNPPHKINILVPNREYRDQIVALLSMMLIKPEDYISFTFQEEVPGLTFIDTKNLHVNGMQTYGFIFEDDEEIVAYSGDLGDCNIIFDHIPKGTEKPARVFHEITFEKTEGIHTYYKDLMPRLADYPIYGYHIDPRENPADNSIPLVAHFPHLLAKGVRGYHP